MSTKSASGLEAIVFDSVTWARQCIASHRSHDEDRICNIEARLVDVIDGPCTAGMTDKPDTRLPGMPGTALLDERVFRQLSAEQVAKQYKLLSLFDQQCSQMHMILVLQMSMTGKDPLAEEAQLNAKPLVPLEATHTDMEGSAGERMQSINYCMMHHEPIYSALSIL